MFWKIARQHLLLEWRDPAALPVSIILAVLLVSISFSGVGRILEQRKAEERFEKEWRQVIQHTQAIDRAIEDRIAAGIEEEQLPPPFGARHPGYPYAWCKPAIIKPAAALSWLAEGKSDIYASGYAAPHFEPVEQIDNPLRLVNGNLDVAFVLVYLLPLCILILSFDLTGSDCETGLLRLTLAQPVRFSTLLSARLGASALPVLGAMFVAAAAIVPGIHRIRDDSDIGARLLMAAAATILYALFWWFAAAAVNSMRRSAPVNATILGSFWLLFVIFIPVTLHAAATFIYPVPPRAELIDAERSAPQRVAKLDQISLSRDFIAHHPEYGYASLDSVPGLGRVYAGSAAREEAEDRIIERETGRFREALRRQEGFIDGFSAFSPAILLNAVLTDLSGTGWRGEEAFQEQKERYVQRTIFFFRSREFRFPNGVFTSQEYDLIPFFEFQDEPVAGVIQRNRRALLWLTLIGGFMGVTFRYLSTRRFPDQIYA
jgi:ABC-2 type transport system permease protein